MPNLSVDFDEFEQPGTNVECESEFVSQICVEDGVDSDFSRRRETGVKMWPSARSWRLLAEGAVASRVRVVCTVARTRDGGQNVLVFWGFAGFVFYRSSHWDSGPGWRVGRSCRVVTL